MNVNLTPELVKFVQEKVQSGLYNSASEVVREALRLMQERDTLRKCQLEALGKGRLPGKPYADPIEDLAFWSTELGQMILAEADDQVSMEDGLKATSGIRGDLSDEVTAERDER